MPLETPLGEPPQVIRDALAPLRNDFSIALFSAGNAFTVGAVIRVAHSFLAREVIVIGGGERDRTGERGQRDERSPRDWYQKASMGMHKYERIVLVPDAAAFRNEVAGRPLWAVEKDFARHAVTAVERFPPGVVFLFGSERFGIPADVIAAADEVVGIPIYGVNHSLPVTVASGIVMHEWARRRYVDGAVG